MAVLSLVLWPGFLGAERDAPQGRALSRVLRPLRRRADAIHAVLPVVPAEGPQTLASPAVRRGLRAMQVVGGFGVLELLPMV